MRSFYLTDLNCRDRIITHEQSIYSPNYPYYYGQRLNCTWKIQAPANRYISLKITTMELVEQEAAIQVGVVYNILFGLSIFLI